MKSHLHVALVQAQLYWRDPAQNRAHLEKLLQAAEPADLYVLPETFTTGFLGESREHDEDMDGPTVDWLRSQAARLGAAVCGSAAIASEAGRRNRLLLAHPGGEVDFYDKRHLFAFAGEDQRYVAGAERTVIDYQGWRICPQICYDLRFPVWCRNRDDYDLLLFVANWPTARVTAWDALLRARAIENQCYVVAVNRVGEDGNGVHYPGHSAIYDPFGDALLPPWPDEGVRSAELSLARVEAVRQDFPFGNEADRFELLD